MLFSSEVRSSGKDPARAAVDCVDKPNCAHFLYPYLPWLFLQQTCRHSLIDFGGESGQEWYVHQLRKHSRQSFVSRDCFEMSEVDVVGARCCFFLSYFPGLLEFLHGYFSGYRFDLRGFLQAVQEYFHVGI